MYIFEVIANFWQRLELRNVQKLFLTISFAISTNLIPTKKHDTKIKQIEENYSLGCLLLSKYVLAILWLEKAGHDVFEIIKPEFGAWIW